MAQKNLPISIVVVAIGFLLLTMTGPTVSKSLEQPHNNNNNNPDNCPQVLDQFPRVARYNNGTQMVLSVTAVLRYAGPLADLQWQWQGPNPARHFADTVLRSSSDTFWLRAFLWNAKDADLGRYRFTVQKRRGIGHACEVVNVEFQAPDKDRAEQSFEFDANSALLNNGGHSDIPTTIVWTKADGTDSPTLTVSLRPKWSNFVLFQSAWTWPNADRLFDDADQVNIGENSNEFSLVVHNATEADLGSYVFGAVGLESQVVMRTVQLKRSE